MLAETQPTADTFRKSLRIAYAFLTPAEYPLFWQHDPRDFPVCILASDIHARNSIAELSKKEAVADLRPTKK